MALTIHQRVHGYLWHWKDGPGWVRDGAQIARLRQAGMRVLKVQLQDDGEIPTDQAKEWRDAGMKVWGMVGHVDGRDPIELAQWLKGERSRLFLAGLDCNYESDVLRMDTETHGQWSAIHAAECRRLMPTLPLHLDSYWGPMGAGINLGAYKANGFRFSVQTAWGQPPVLWADPPTNIVKKGLGAQPVIPKAIIKPIFFIVPGEGGANLDMNMAYADAKAAGTLGCGLYYIDGAQSIDEVIDWTKRAIQAGVAY
jgi:hypothetical protein